MGKWKKWKEDVPQRVNLAQSCCRDNATNHTSESRSQRVGVLILLHMSVTVKSCLRVGGGGVSFQTFPAFRVCRWSKVESVLTPWAQQWSSDTYASCQEQKHMGPLCKKMAKEPKRYGWSSDSICYRGSHCLKNLPSGCSGRKSDLCSQKYRPSVLIFLTKNP